jgi:hypothetical protein
MPAPPRWVLAVLVILLLVLAGAWALDAVITITLINKVNREQVQTCELYAELRAFEGSATVTMPPGC